VVTIRDLRTATGAGGQIYASTTTSGTIDNFTVILSGSGYSTASSANFPGFEPFSFATDNDSGTEEDSKTVIVVRPGGTRVINAHFGSGIKSVGVQ
jgi:hypothetical protein